MRLSTFTLIAVVGFFVAGLQLAMGEKNDQPTAVKTARNGQNTETTAENNRYVATGDLIVRDSPPTGWLYFKGEQVGTLKKNQQVFLLERRKVGDLFVEQEWMKISDLEGEITGWVYNGRTEADLPYLSPLQGA